MSFADQFFPVFLFVLLAIGELFWPDRPPGDLAFRRWLGNFLLFAFGAAFLLLLPLSAVLEALHQPGGPAGSFAGLARYLDLPPGLTILVSIVLLDAFAYGRHFLSHNVALLWRLHAPHHSDPELDITTTIRHHPADMLIGVIATGALVWLLGVPVEALVIHGLLDRAVQLPAHGNIRYPGFIDRTLSAVLVTPSFHRVHHSRSADETNSNYGQIFSFWDRLFGTSRSCTPPAAFGLDLFRDGRSQDLPHLLLQPLMRQSVAEAVR